MLNKILKPLILGVFAVVIVSSLSSCQKNKDTIGVIIVKDTNGNTVPGATVVLHQDGMISPQGQITSPDVRKSDITDASGKAEFTYELEMILNVEVVKVDGNDTYTGSNVIRLLKEKTVTKVVEIRN